MLDISGPYSGHGMVEVIKDIDICVDKGELVSLLGADGVDKPALLKSAIGVVHAKRGSIKYQEKEFVGKRPHEVIPIGISIVSEGHKIFADVTVMENLAIGSYTRTTDKALDQGVLDQVFEFFPRLAERKVRMGGILSGSEQRVLAIGRAMMSDPKPLLLNELSMDLVSLVVEQVFHIIEKLKRTGITILLVERNARMAIKVSDRSYMLNTRKTAGGLDASDGASQNALLEVYLGKGGK